MTYQCDNKKCEDYKVEKEFSTTTSRWNKDLGKIVTIETLCKCGEYMEYKKTTEGFASPINFNLTNRSKTFYEKRHDNR